MHVRRGLVHCPEDVPFSSPLLFLTDPLIVLREVLGTVDPTDLYLGPGVQGSAFGPLDGLFLRGEIDDPEPVEHLSQLTIGSIGGNRVVVAEVDDGAFGRVGQSRRVGEDPSVDHRFVVGTHRGDDLFEIGVLGGIDRGLVGIAHNEHEFHDDSFIIEMSEDLGQDPLTHCVEPA